MRFRILLILALVAPSVAVHAVNTLDPTAAVSTLNLLISQYESRIKQLESENAILRNEMVKAGIKIPLSEYSWAVITEVSAYPSVPIVIPVTVTWSQSEIWSGANTAQSWVDASLALTEQYGKDVSAFVSKIHKDWTSIKDFYKFNTWAKIAGYEFVQSWANDYVFVDVVFGTGTSGIYDMKILYQFEKKEYKRRLVGIFEYNTTYGKYVTRPGGTNPFAGIPRTFIKDPYYAGVVVVPSTVLSSSGASATTNVSSSVPTPTPTESTQPTSPTSSAELADILKAYSEKKYLSTISLSNTYLEKNPPTVEVLNVRYRTYFIIGKFTESLAELVKIESLGGLDRQTACNAQVIATYSKNQALIDKYTAACKK
jgi:hypothetical protein